MMQGLQQVLSSLTGENFISSNASQPITNGTTPVLDTQTIPTSLSSLVTLLFSFAALRDWLKLIVIGGFFETCRRVAFALYYKVVNSFWITVSFEEDDPSYDWMMVWLSKQPSWTQARELQVSTRSFGLNSTAVLVPGEETDPMSAASGSRKLAYLPSISSTYSLWYKRRWITITRSRSQTGYYGRQEETLTISILARSHKFLNELLLEAKREYLAAQEHTISIHISDTSNNWKYVASRPKRPLRSIVLDPGIKDLLLNDAKDFLESKNWYVERGIPFRRGYLLYGAPGSGKTSMIHSIAGELGLDVYIISLSRAGLDDTSLNEIISDLPEQCIALMEDIDAAFHHGLNRDSMTTVTTTPATTTPATTTPVDPQTTSPTPPPTTSKLSLSGLLNALDGIGAQEGRILYATTNKYSALDSALCRPGRMDIHVEFKLASKYQAQELFRCFYLPIDDSEEGSEDEATEKESLDSGYGSLSRGKCEINDGDTASEASETPSSSSTPDEAIYSGNSHTIRAPDLSRRQVAKLARAFADAIPERELSMATLQGYLMTYKTRPFDAVKDAAAWVQKEKANKLAKENAAKPVGS